MTAAAGWAGAALLGTGSQAGSLGELTRSPSSCTGNHQINTGRRAGGPQQLGGGREKREGAGVMGAPRALPPTLGGFPEAAGNLGFHIQIPSLPARIKTSVNKAK